MDPHRSLRRPPSPTAGRLGRATAGSAAVAAWLLLASPAAAQSKIAIVDVQRAVLETEEAARGTATLKKLADARQGQLATTAQAIQADREALEKEARDGKTPMAGLQKKAGALQKRVTEFETAKAGFEQEIQKKQQELTTPILQRMLGLVKRLATQDGYELVVDKSAAPYYRADLELTDKAIQMYNAGQAADVASASKAPPGKPAKGPKPKAAPPK